jgi:hypothetical protein
MSRDNGSARASALDGDPVPLPPDVAATVVAVVAPGAAEVPAEPSPDVESDEPVPADTDTVPEKSREDVPEEFVAEMVNAMSPNVVGVPLIVPVRVLRLNPAGNAPPETVYRGAGGPDAVYVAVNCVPTDIANTGALPDHVGLAGATICPLNACDADPTTFVAVIVNEYVCGKDGGVPVISPVVGSSCIWLGKEPVVTA